MLTIPGLVNRSGSPRWRPEIGKSGHELRSSWGWWIDVARDKLPREVNPVRERPRDWTRVH
ncbi:MAG TPA: hypothetical protein VM487_01200, partial [Phycisphaerae bacterium]|nr:hypothetical protein [Phycisphaerae bacterium]